MVRLSAKNRRRYLLPAFSLIQAINFLLCWNSCVLAQSPDTAQAAAARQSVGVLQSAAATQQAEPQVELNVQGRMQLDALLNYISKRLGVKFEYTPQIGERVVVIRTPSAVPVSSLPALLSSILRTESLALIDSDIAGWKRIVDTKEMAQFAPTGKAEEVLARDGKAAPVTQVFVLKNTQATAMASVLKPFLSTNGSNLISLAESNVLIVTDYAARVQTVADLIAMIDQPPGSATYELYKVQHQASQTLTEQVKGILAEGSAQLPGNIAIFNEPVGNRIVIAGSQMMVERARELLRQLDVTMGMTTEVYRLKHSTPERIDKLMQGFIEPQDAEGGYQATVDEDGNLLIVRATRAVHQQVARLIAELDQPVEATDSPIQFYKLRNASAIDVLYTLLALQEAYGAGPFQGGVVPLGLVSPFAGLGIPSLNGGGLGTMTGLPALNGMGLDGGTVGMQRAGIPLETMQLPLTPDSNGFNNQAPFVPETANPLARPTLASGGFGGTGLSGGFAGGGVATLPGGARVSADVSTNSLIVVAPTSVQGVYAKLIESLDQRRPQVLIEAKIIAIDTSDEFTLGVEVAFGDRKGDKRLFEFTSFGLSEVDAETGTLRIIPGLGFNGTLVDPDVADVVVRALSGHRRARVLAAPKILVNDNSTGKLESVSSVPFSSVNASQTVSTTSLGGNQQAGTIITVTPHINEDDHLQLEFDVEFSTFAGTGSDGLPPPRQIDRVGSTVTIPDGKTVVVGGLKRVGGQESVLGLPWIENIPVLRELTSRTDRSQNCTSFFLFIRPLVLRDSRFADLRFLSDRDAATNCLPGDFPVSYPELIP